MGRALGALRGDKFVRNVGILATGAAIGQAAALLASPILSRLYSPEDFGILGVYASVLAVASVSATLRYEYAIPLAEDDYAAANTFGLTLLLSIGMSAIISVLVTVLLDQLVATLGAPGLRRYMFLVPIGVLALGIYQSFNYWALRQRAFSRVARTKLSQGLSGVATQLGLGALGFTPIGLLLGQIVSQAAGVLTLSRTVGRREVSVIGFKGIANALIRYRRFPFYTFPSAIMNTASLSLPPLLLAALFSPAVAGLYFFAQRILRTPMALVSQSVSQVFYGEAARLRNEEPEELLRLHNTTTRQLFGIAILPMLLLAIAGGPIFGLVFGEAWHEAGNYAQLLVPFLLAQFVVSPLSQTFSLLEAQSLLLLVNAIKLILSVGPIVVAHVLGLAPQVAIAGFSVGLSANYLFVLFLSRYLIKQHIANIGSIAEG